MPALVTLVAAALGSGIATTFVQRLFRTEKDKNPDLWSARFKAAQELISALDNLQSSIYSAAGFTESMRKYPALPPQLLQMQKDMFSSSLKQMGAFGEVYSRNKFCLPPETHLLIEDFLGCCIYVQAKFGIGEASFINLSATAQTIKGRTLEEGKETVTALKESAQTALSKSLENA